MDGGWGGQQSMLFDKFTVNTDVYDAQQPGVVPEAGTLVIWSLLFVGGVVAHYYRHPAAPVQ